MSQISMSRKALLHDVERYIVEITDEKTGDTIFSSKDNTTSFVLLKGEYNSGTQYLIRVGAVPKNGEEADAVWTEEKFILIG